VYILSLSF